MTLGYLAVVSFTGVKDIFISFATFAGDEYVRFLVFVFVLQVAFSVLKFPLDFYADFRLEHKYGLSNEGIGTWLLRKFKGALVGAILTLVVLVAFYFLLVNYPGSWWLIFACFFFLFQILVAQLFPTLILPLFYKLKPLENSELHTGLKSLVEKFGYRMSGVFSFDLSKETKKANAALTGLGKTRKIIMSDTLLQNFSEKEIQVVMTHELGHLVKHHMMKGIVASAILSLLGFFVMAQIYAAYTAGLGVPLSNLTAIPFLALLVTAFGIMAMPLGNFYSRRIEHEADAFAISQTGMKEEFAESMRKLGRLNMTPENPPAWIEKIFFSHPSIGARISYALRDGKGPENQGFAGEVK